MMNRIAPFYLLIIWTANLAFNSCGPKTNLPTGTPEPKPVKGLTLVAPPKPFEENPMTDVLGVGANYIAVVPYAFTPPEKAEVHFGSHHQWWGESPQGVLATIDLAHKNGIKVMLKPQVWSHGQWTGDYTFNEDAEWEQWEKQYTDYILFFARIADSLSVESFCIGTEFKSAIRERPHFWLSLIDSVRETYEGTITYAANWDNFENIHFWNQLDFIGINAYFPLSDETTPSVKDLIRKWQPHVDQIRALHTKYDLPVVFTEYGYLSVDGCAHSTWELEGVVKQLAINQKAQANAIEALHKTFSLETYWHGGFLWKWFPNMEGHEGYPARDYTPQGKLAEKVLANYFKSGSK